MAEEATQSTATADTAPASESAKPSESTETEQAPDPDLADPGKRALESERRARRAAERERSQLNAELEALRLSQKSEHEQAIEKARREGADESEKVWKAKFHEASKRNEALRVMSAAGVSAPELVMPHLNLSEVEVDENGKVDASAIEARLHDVLETYPMLAAPDGQPSVHHADLGAKKRPAQTTDVNSALRMALGSQPKRRH